MEHSNIFKPWPTMPHVKEPVMKGHFVADIEVVSPKYNISL